ncbi:MAG: acyl-CoA dehydrogenase family protein [Polyangiaceae bacterium]|jgi:glutaryl-CoA dehydrogenase|nr:acyl-CoA dehydrogenase family protein [Polyangiaceae bacterium]
MKIDDPMPLEALSAIEPLLTDEERMIRDSVRRFVRERYLPRAPRLYEEEEFPQDLIPEIAAMGLLGASLEGYGCAGMGAVAYGLALQELEYGDSGLRSFVSVQGSLSMYPIHRYGSEEQKQRFLPKMARGEYIGCFGLTEPDAGSDPGAMKTYARRDGDHWVLNGSKMWITNAPFAHLAVVWAKTMEGDTVGGPESIRGFVVERGTPGFETPTIHGKMSLRASTTGEIVLDNARVPDANVLPGVRGLGGPLSCLNQARFGIAFSVLGAARACYDASLAYTRNRVAFGRPIAGKQLVQEQLVEMASEIAKGEILALHLGRLKEQNRLSPQQVSLAKRNNVGWSLKIARMARALLGGNGILLDYPAIRHAMNLESVYTYEGTHEVHTLILGRALTGIDAFLTDLVLATRGVRAVRSFILGSCASTRARPSA